MLESLLERIAAALRDAGIPYMVSDGQAVLLYGEPRLTKVIDIKRTRRHSAALGRNQSSPQRRGDAEKNLFSLRLRASAVSNLAKNTVLVLGDHGEFFGLKYLIRDSLMAILAI